MLAFKFMSDLFQKSTLFTIMLFSFGNPTQIALSLSLSFLFFCTGDIHSMPQLPLWYKLSIAV